MGFDEHCLAVQSVELRSRRQQAAGAQRGRGSMHTEALDSASVSPSQCHQGSRAEARSCLRMANTLITMKTFKNDSASG